MPPYVLRYHPTPYPKSLNISTIAGVTVLESITEAAWNSTFSVGCKPLPFPSDLHHSLSPPSICLERLSILSPSDHKSLVIQVFWRYITVMRLLQSTYWLEPAGSHGVWGLDDYHFLPFLFGSAQLRGHKYIRPRAIHDPEMVDEYAKDYMYFACIKFINSVCHLFPFLSND